MDLLRKAQATAGTGLRGSGKASSLYASNQRAADIDVDFAPRVAQTFVEPGEYNVMLEGETLRPATLKSGELVPYSIDEMAELKDTNLAFGKIVHTFTGHVKYGTHVRDGPGFYHYGSGEVFEGRYKNNQRHGLGGLYLPSGYYYEGNFTNDRPHGRGREVFPTGDQYIGDFVNGRPQGHGVLYYVDNGSRYEGGWENGDKHGNGTVFYNNGDVFQGTWIAGKREGEGYTTYASTGKTFASTWRKDVCDTKLRFVSPDHVPEPKSDASPVDSISSPLGIDLRLLRVADKEWLEVHPGHFVRVMQAFESLDSECSGEIEMTYLQEVWDPNNMETLQTLERAATTVGADDTLELIEVLTGLYPHLPPQETKRWIAVDVSPESLLRLRGMLAGVASAKSDGFYAISNNKRFVSLPLVQMTHKNIVGGMRVSLSMFVRGNILANAHGEKNDATTTSIGGAAGGESFAGAYGGEYRLSFPQLLRQVFPNLWPETFERVEMESVPHAALLHYCAAFDRLNADSNSGYLSLESMKAAQKKYQLARASGAMSFNVTNAYERYMEPGFFQHQCRWLVGDVSVTVSLVKAVDRSRTGHLSLAELLRYSYPNVPCLQTKERLGEKVRSDETCQCDICDFCGQKYLKPRPPNPYLDGNLTW